MSEILLKPCPFCKSPGTFRIIDRVSCGNPECFFFSFAWREEDWQKRPIEDALRAEVERLRKFVLGMFAEGFGPAFDSGVALGLCVEKKPGEYTPTFPVIQPEPDPDRQMNAQGD